MRSIPWLPATASMRPSGDHTGVRFEPLTRRLLVPSDFMTATPLPAPLHAVT